MMKRILRNLLLLSVSLVVSVLIAEFLARIALDPVDHLRSHVVADEFLGHRIEGLTGGHDAWGFRNARLPVAADIVCIGDSFTYGLAALARDSWPAVLGELRADTVYNMALGGYGPIQYLHLMRTLAVKLHPKIVIVGLFLGNDLLDAYNMVRNNKNWEAYRTLGDLQAEAPEYMFFYRQSGRFLGALRDWLGRNSVLYESAVDFPVFDFVRKSEFSAVMRDEVDGQITYRDDKHHVNFHVARDVRFLDMKDQRVRTAIEVTKRVMLDMQVIAKKEAIRLVVAFIPTQPRVYEKLLQQAGYADRYPEFAAEFEQEDAVRNVFTGFLRENNFEVVDLLPSLESEVRERDLYPLTDAHMNKEGYRVIAETINRYLGNPHRPDQCCQSIER